MVSKHTVAVCSRRAAHRCSRRHGGSTASGHSSRLCIEAGAAASRGDACGQPLAAERGAGERRALAGKGGRGVALRPEVPPFSFFLTPSVISLACFAALSTWYFWFSSFSVSSALMISSTFIGWNFLRKCGLIAYVFGWPALSLSAMPATFAAPPAPPAPPVPPPASPVCPTTPPSPLALPFRHSAVGSNPLLLRNTEKEIQNNL